jgi:hypothetical protein
MDRHAVQFPCQVVVYEGDPPEDAEIARILTQILSITGPYLKLLPERYLETRGVWLFMNIDTIYLPEDDFLMVKRIADALDDEVGDAHVEDLDWN